MTASLIVICLTLIVMQLCVIFDWKIKTKHFSFDCYWIVCLIGTILCICCGFITKSSLKNVFVSNDGMNPMQILIIFISASSISVLLDKIGFFSYVAKVALIKAKSSQTKLFFVFNIVIAILTIFTSNDIIILTFTPFICFFTKNAKIDATPYLVSEFVSANAWSMFFYIDNPTNIFLCSNHGITFWDYTISMLIPAFVAGLFSLLLTYLIFRKKLKEPINIETQSTETPNKPLMTIGLTSLFLMIIFMMVGPYIGLDIWYIPLICALGAYYGTLIYYALKRQKPTILLHAVRDLPYSLIPFLLSMAIIVATLKDVGFIQKCGKFLDGQNIFVIGFLAFLVGNVINNIPMSMLFTGILSYMSVGANIVFSVVVASNICAILTPIGSLAGIMFMTIVKENDVKFSVKQFIGYGTVVSIPVMAISLLMLLV